MLPVYDIDRIVFASSLVIHIIIASISIGMPFAIGTLELYGILKKDENIKILAQKISTLILVLFAIGTLSGTIVAVEMYTLFPKFMQIVSNTAIISLYIEVLAFFMESLFVGIYFYSFKKYNNSCIASYIYVFNWNICSNIWFFNNNIKFFYELSCRN